MNHIRGLFRPAPTTRVSGHDVVSKKSKSKGKGASQSSQHRSRNTPTPPRPSPPPQDAPARPEPHVSSAISVASSNGLDHLYEQYCENMQAAERKPALSSRKACMVLREYNDEYVTPSTASTAHFLPREYNIVVDNDDDSSSGVEDMSDILTRTQGTTLLKGSPQASSAEVSSSSATAVMADQECGSEVENAFSYESGAVVTAAPATRSLPLTTSKVFALNSDEEGTEGSTVNRTPAPLAAEPPEKLRKKKLVRNARQVAPAGVANELEAPESSEADGDFLAEQPPLSQTGARYNESSWSFVEEEAKLQGHVRHVVVPAPTTAADAASDDAANRACEVEVVRLNDALFTPTELARWRHYQVTRMDSFVGATGNDAATPSASTRSRDVPSSNSASGPEFMPMLMATAETGASQASERGWVEMDAEAEACGGVPMPRGRLIRVCCTADIPPPQLPDVAASPSSTQPVQEGAISAVSAGDSSSSCSTSSGSNSSCDEDDNASRSASASRSPSVTSLDAVSATAPALVRLPQIVGKPRAAEPAKQMLPAIAKPPPQQQQRLVDRSEKQKPLSTDAGSMHPLPPVARPQNLPAFQRRAQR